MKTGFNPCGFLYKHLAFMMSVIMFVSSFLSPVSVFAETHGLFDVSPVSTRVTSEILNTETEMPVESSTEPTSTTEPATEETTPNTEPSTETQPTDPTSETDPPSDDPSTSYPTEEDDPTEPTEPEEPGSEEVTDDATEPSEEATEDPTIITPGSPAAPTERIAIFQTASTAYTIAFGTDRNSPQFPTLPSTIEARIFAVESIEAGLYNAYNQPPVISIPVMWNATPVFDAFAPDSYVFTPEFNRNSFNSHYNSAHEVLDIDMASTPIITVEVLAPVFTAINFVLLEQQIARRYVAFGTERNMLGLPDTLQATVDVDGLSPSIESIEVVSWIESVNSPTFDPIATGQTIEFVPQFTPEVESLLTTRPSIQITILSPEIEVRNITLLPQIAVQEVAFGDISSVVLPTELYVTYYIPAPVSAIGQRSLVTGTVSTTYLSGITWDYPANFIIAPGTHTIIANFPSNVSLVENVSPPSIEITVHEAVTQIVSFETPVYLMNVPYGTSKSAIEAILSVMQWQAEEADINLDGSILGNTRNIIVEATSWQGQRIANANAHQYVFTALTFGAGVALHQNTSPISVHVTVSTRQYEVVEFAPEILVATVPFGTTSNQAVDAIIEMLGTDGLVAHTVSVNSITRTFENIEITGWQHTFDGLQATSQALTPEIALPENVINPRDIQPPTFTVIVQNPEQYVVTEFILPSEK